LLNHGGGIGHHRVLSLEGKKEKRCYQSEEYEVDLNSDDGAELIKRFIQLTHEIIPHEDPNQIIKAKDASDLYGLLILHGKKRETIDKLDQKSVTPQRTGTCTVTNVHAVGRDILVDQGANLAERKRYHFVIKLRSLIAAYDAYQKGVYPRILLEWALREFAVRFNKHYTDMSDDEKNYCGELHAEINERLIRDKNEEVRKKCESVPFPNREGDVTDYNEAPIHTKAITPKDFITFFESHSGKMTSDKQLDLLCALLQTDDSPNFFDRIYDLLNQLPHCSGEKTDVFWDQIKDKSNEQREADEKIIENYLYRLSEIVTKLGSPKFKKPLERSRMFAACMIIYDIAAQLASRCEDLKLYSRSHSQIN